MKISTRTIISSVVASLFVSALALAQVEYATDYAMDGSVSTPQPSSGPAGTASENVSTNRRRSVPAESGAMYDYEEAMLNEYAMYDDMMAEGYGYEGPQGMPFGTGRKIFVIPSTQIEIDDHIAIERDIRVMSHILDRVLRKPVNKLGGVFTVMDDFFGRDSQVTQVVYLEGYGALFLMNVDFALVGPPQPSQAEEPNEPGEKVDTTWQQAERELYAPPGVGTRRSGVGGRRSEGDRQRSQYDAGKVELLKPTPSSQS